MPPVMNGMARNYVTVPPPDVATGGFLAAARVIESSDPHDLLGAEYQTDACAVTEFWNFYCPTPEDVVSEGHVKEFEEAPEIVQGDPFTLYAGVACTLQRLEEAAQRAQSRFNYGERAGVDSAVAFQIANLATTVDGGPLPLPAALGAVENYMATQYGGQPYIAIPLTLMGCACEKGLVSRNLDGTLETCSGSKVVNYVNTSAAAGQNIYATGQITLLRGPMSVISVPQQPLGDGTYEPPRALAERTYVPLIECLAVKIEATCS